MSFKCKSCGCVTNTLETRTAEHSYRRRRECKKCGERVTTYEISSDLLKDNAELVKALREAADHISELSYDHNFNDCDMPEKYRAIADANESP